MSLPLRVKKFIQKNKLFSHGDKVIVGVSGGSDSIFLLHVLSQLKHELGISLVVTHYNHRLRKEADRDEIFVKQKATDLNLPYITDVWKGSKNKLKGSLEDLARRQRLSFLQKASLKFKTNLVALAHTQDDLAETVLMRIMRGSGLKGIRSILPQRTIHNLHIARPLLDISKKDILAYLQKHKLKFREDATNKTAIFLRNKIRLELLPLLQKEYNPNITLNLVNFAKHTDADYNFIQKEAAAAYTKILLKSARNQRRIDLKKFTRLHPSLQHMTVHLIMNDLKQEDCSLETRHFDEIEQLLHERKPINTIVHLPKNVLIKKLHTSLNFELH